MKKIIIAPKWDILPQFRLKKLVRLALGIYSKDFPKILCDDRVLYVNKSDISEYFEKMLISPKTGFAPFWVKKLVLFVPGISSMKFFEILYDDRALRGEV